ncbi:MAG: heavy metal translocating P-type ATPase [Clostridia bacterium]
MEDLATTSSKKNIETLADIRPDTVTKVEGETETKVKAETINIGETFLVAPFERIGLDGIVTKGSSMLDTSALTGESMPVDVKEGSKVMSGSINISSSILVKASAKSKDSAASRILEIVEEAASKKSRAEKYISRFAQIYTPLVICIAALVACVPTIFFAQNVDTWIYRALVFLVVSCPCALVISIPLSFFAGIGAASKRGILVKGSAYLESMQRIKTLVLDKTGTVTEGKFKIQEIKAAGNEEELLEAAAYAEYRSSHPIAKILVDAYANTIDARKIISYAEIPGKGAKVDVLGEEILAGSAKLLQQEGVQFTEAISVGTHVYIAKDKKYLGHITLGDSIKVETKEAVQRIKKLGIDVVMLTGDKKEIAEKVAKETNIDKVFSELMPEDKLRILEEILEKKENKKDIVAYIGDGINDAPALKRADIGIAMGGAGADSALEAADIVFMQDNLMKVEEGIKISKKTKKIVIQNIVFALTVKCIFMLLGTAGISSVWEAVFADVGVSILAIINATRCMKIK